MWLPTPIYERIPQFWLLLGLLFMTSGTYLGFDYSLSFLYFGVGFVCCIWSIWIFAMRSRSRKFEVQEQPIQLATTEEQAETPPDNEMNQRAETVA